ncbi:MAG: hypothetical protein Q4Q13_00785 [Vagococcus sp.]|nr:hypothetical protein [Vagococcus sp.]
MSIEDVGSPEHVFELSKYYGIICQYINDAIEAKNWTSLTNILELPLVTQLFLSNYSRDGANRACRLLDLSKGNISAFKSHVVSHISHKTFIAVVTFFQLGDDNELLCAHIMKCQDCVNNALAEYEGNLTTENLLYSLLRNLKFEQETNSGNKIQIPGQRGVGEFELHHLSRYSSQHTNTTSFTHVINSNLEHQLLIQALNGDKDTVDRSWCLTFTDENGCMKFELIFAAMLTSCVSSLLRYEFSHSHDVLNFLFKFVEYIDDTSKSIDYVKRILLIIDNLLLIIKHPLFQYHMQKSNSDIVSIDEISELYNNIRRRIGVDKQEDWRVSSWLEDMEGSFIMKLNSMSNRIVSVLNESELSLNELIVSLSKTCELLEICGKGRMQLSIPFRLMEISALIKSGDYDSATKRVVFVQKQIMNKTTLLKFIDAFFPLLATAEIINAQTQQDTIINKKTIRKYLHLLPRALQDRYKVLFNQLLEQTYFMRHIEYSDRQVKANICNITY